jgi:hypothetical protein
MSALEQYLAQDVSAAGYDHWTDLQDKTGEGAFVRIWIRFRESALEPVRVRDVFTTSQDHCTDLQDQTGEKSLCVDPDLDLVSRIWSQIESEMCLHQTKTIAQICKTKQLRELLCGSG